MTQAEELIDQWIIETLSRAPALSPKQIERLRSLMVPVGDNALNIKRRDLARKRAAQADVH